MLELRTDLDRERDRDPDAGWVSARWVKILDRIDHRQPDVGLRFWGPPLWLEVTMSGPDSDQWPAVAEQPAAWDWQSSAPCAAVAALTEQGADDDRLLAVVGRYTIENLILNAVHEIGEWFRFDGARLFPAHLTRALASSDGDDQGNGAVALQLAFGPDAVRSAAAPASPLSDHDRRDHLVRRLTDVAAPSRFTYLPGTAISYEVTGPVVQRWSAGEPTTAWSSTWSAATIHAAGSDGPDALEWIGRDVHRAIVWHEADRICRAFHVDGRRPWRLAVPRSAPGADPPDTDAFDAEELSLSIDHADSGAPDGRPPAPAC